MPRDERIDRIIFVSMILLVLLGALSFFVQPIYEKGAWIALTAVSSALSGALGFRFGITIPRPTAGEETKPAP